MTKKRSTKRALLMSALSLMMCMSMLIGSTFAWFTDSVTSSGNKIVAGTLDVRLLMNTGAGYEDISESTSPIFGGGSIAQDNNAETLWEPGKTQVAYLAIENKGNLALKYKVDLNVENVSKDLYEVMEYAIIPDAQYDSVSSWKSGNGVTVGTQTVSEDVSLPVGTTHYFALAIHMDETAGNEYQGGEVDFDLTVMATQLASESDSFGNDYDNKAVYEEDVQVESQPWHELDAVKTDTVVDGGTYNFDVTAYAAEGCVATQNSDGTYTVEKNVVPEGATFVSDGLYKDNTDNVYYITNANGLKAMQENVSATTSGSVNDGEWVLFKDIDMSGVAWTPISNFHGDFNGNGKTISNLTVNADGAAGLFGTNTYNGDGYIVPTIKNLNVTKANVTGTVKVGVVVGGISAIKIDSVNVTDSTATGTEFVGGIQGWSYGPAGATITNCTVTGCTIQNTSTSTDGKVGGIGGYIALGTVENCTVSNSTISGYRCVGALLGRGGNAGDELTMTISNYNVSGNTVTSTSDTAGEVVGDALKVEYK